MDSNQWALRHPCRKRALNDSMCGLSVGVTGLEKTNWSSFQYAHWSNAWDRASNDELFYNPLRHPERLIPWDRYRRPFVIVQTTYQSLRLFRYLHSHRLWGDPRVEVELNGVLVVEADLELFDTPGMNPGGTSNKFKYAWKTMPRMGHIGLQTHAGMGGLSDLKIRFRNLVVQTL